MKKAFKRLKVLPKVAAGHMPPAIKYAEMSFANKRPLLDATLCHALARAENRVCR